MKILIAEDDLNIRNGLFDILSQEGYQVTLAENGKVAIDKYNQEIPDFVVLDIMMPEMDGYSVCKEIRKTNDDIPIIFLSAKTEEIDKVVGLELGADDFISKPFGVSELKARIKAISRRVLSKTKKLGDSFIFGHLEIFPNELRAKSTELNIDLSLREINILKCFKTNQSKVVTRDMLFDFVWGYEHYPNSRTLDQHISKIRKLIELDPANPKLIQTVHGQGYRFD